MRSVFVCVYHRAMAGDRESWKFDGWEEDGFGGLTLNITLHGTQIRLATVVKVEADAGDLWETYVGLPFEKNQRGRWDASRDRAVAKAETFLIEKLRRLL